MFRTHTSVGLRSGELSQRLSILVQTHSIFIAVPLMSFRVAGVPCLNPSKQNIWRCNSIGTILIIGVNSPQKTLPRLALQVSVDSIRLPGYSETHTPHKSAVQNKNIFLFPCTLLPRTCLCIRYPVSAMENGLPNDGNPSRCDKGVTSPRVYSTSVLFIYFSKGALHHTTR